MVNIVRGSVFASLLFFLSLSVASARPTWGATRKLHQLLEKKVANPYAYTPHIKTLLEALRVEPTEHKKNPDAITRDDIYTIRKAGSKLAAMAANATRQNSDDEEPVYEACTNIENIFYVFGEFFDRAKEYSKNTAELQSATLNSALTVLDSMLTAVEADEKKWELAVYLYLPNKLERIDRMAQSIGNNRQTKRFQSLLTRAIIAFNQSAQRCPNAQGVRGRAMLGLFALYEKLPQELTEIAAQDLAHAQEELMCHSTMLDRYSKAKQKLETEGAQAYRFKGVNESIERANRLIETLTSTIAKVETLLGGN